MAFTTFEIYNVVRVLADFPAPVAGVITLPNNTAWIITKPIDLGVNRIVCQNTLLWGPNVRIASLTCNNAGAMITTTGNMITQNLTLSNIGAGTIFNANGTGIVGSSFFTCEYVLVDGSRMGTIQNYNSIYLYRTFMINLLGGLTIDGTVNAFTLMDGSMSTTAAITLISFPATLVVGSRLRIMFTQMTVGNAGATGVNLNAAATVNPESYINNFTNYSGAGTFLAGILPTDTKSLFKNNRGITNSSTMGQFFMNGNVTATTNPGIGTFAKAAGTSTAADTERFTHTTGRLTYNGTLQQRFAVTVVGTLSTNAGNEIAIRIAKNGTTVAASENQVTANGATTFMQFTCQLYTSLVQNDFLEVFVANTSSGANNVTVRFLNVMVNAVP